MNAIVSLKRPLVPVWAATAILDCTEDEIIRKIQSGDLPFAFDLRRDGAQRACIRILSKCISDLQSRGPALKSHSGSIRKSNEQELIEVINSFVPATRVSFRSGEVARIFNCNLSHVSHLAKTGSLPRQPIRSAFRTTHKISRGNIVRFLIQRRVA